MAVNGLDFSEYGQNYTQEPVSRYKLNGNFGFNVKGGSANPVERVGSREITPLSGGNSKFALAQKIQPGKSDTYSFSGKATSPEGMKWLYNAYKEALEPKNQFFGNA